MKFTVSVLAVAALLGVAPASAQPRWVEGPGYVQGLPLRVIMNVVRSQGLRPIARPRMHGHFYVVPATDRFAVPYHVVVDARSGRVTRIQAMGGPVGARTASAEPSGRRSNFGMRGTDEFQGSYGPREDGRRALPPMQRRANLSNETPEEPSATESPPNTSPPRAERRNARPATPPMPRPRPQVASAPAVTPAPAAQEAAPAPQPAEVAPAQPAEAQPAQPAEAQPAQQPAQAQPEQKPARAASAPRVVLPGGPVPKHERSATRPGRTAQNARQGATVGAAPETAASAGSAATETPAQAPAATPAPAAQPSGIPPAQTYE